MTTTVLVTEGPHLTGWCITCDAPMPGGPFLRHMAGLDNEAVPAGTVGDECRPCAERYGRSSHFDSE